MFLKLFIAIYTEQHLKATKNVLEQLGYTLLHDFPSKYEEGTQKATFVETTSAGKYNVYTINQDTGRNNAHNYNRRVINTRQLRGVHRRLRTSFSQDNHSKLEIVPVHPINIFPRLEHLSPEETAKMQASIKWSAPKVPTPNMYFKLCYNTAINWTKALVKRLVRHFK